MHYPLRIALVVHDFLLLNVVFNLVYWYADSKLQAMQNKDFNGYIFVFNLLWFMGAAYFQMYSIWAARQMENLYRVTWRTVVFQLVFFITFILFSRKEIGYSRQFLAILCAAQIVIFGLSRFYITFIDLWLRRKIHHRRKVAILGFNQTGIKLSEFFQQHDTDFEFSGFLDPKGANLPRNGALVPYVAAAMKRAAEKNINEIYAAISPNQVGDVRRLMDIAEHSMVRLRLVPDIASVMVSRMHVEYLHEFPVLQLRPEPLENGKNRFKKRMLDLAVSSLVIIFILSWMVPLFAIIIKLQSPGPIFFKQLRSGRNNEPFWCYKFRSMRVNKESDKRQASKDDDRIYPFGSFLRKSSLDEMPQFLNVFLGDMSVVGPRPHMLAHTEQYQAIIDKFLVRHFLKPGITGWAQVKGFRGETKDPKLMEERVRRDIWYLEHWNFMLDIRIIFLTAYVVAKGDENAF